MLLLPHKCGQPSRVSSSRLHSCLGLRSARMLVTPTSSQTNIGGDSYSFKRLFQGGWVGKKKNRAEGRGDHVDRSGPAVASAQHLQRQRSLALQLVSAPLGDCRVFLGWRSSFRGGPSFRPPNPFQATAPRLDVGLAQRPPITYPSLPSWASPAGAPTKCRSPSFGWPTLSSVRLSDGSLLAR